MLNLKIKDYSRKGVVLFFCVLVAGIVLRVLSLKTHDADESILSQIYYSQHLDQVFFQDSQTPFYYFFTRLWTLIFPASVASIRTMMMVVSLGLGSFCTLLIIQKRFLNSGLMFFMAWCLWPVHIIIFETITALGVLLICLWFLKRDIRPMLLWPLLAILQLVHPIFILMVWGLTALDWYRNKLFPPELRFIFSTSLPVLIYYVVKIWTLGFEKSSFELYSLYSLTFMVPICFMALQKKAFEKRLILMLALIIAVATYKLRPWIGWIGDDKAVDAFKTYTSELYERPVVICATIPQQDYYFKMKQDCQFEVLKHQLAKSEFYFFDLSGTRTDLVGFLKKNAPHVEEKKFHHATFLSVTY